MRALRWLVLVPSCVALLYLFFTVTVAAHYLAEQHLCPAAAFDRGICNHRGMTFALKSLLHLSMALAVLAVGVAATWIAPAGKRPVLWATLAVLIVAAAAFGYAGNAWSLFLAALVGAAVCAVATPRLLRLQAPARE
jgi:MFS family permease